MCWSSALTNTESRYGTANFSELYIPVARLLNNIAEYVSN